MNFSNSTSNLSPNFIQVWPAPTNADEFPEKISDNMKIWRDNHQKNIGVAISGGGMRAASNALGWLRALNKHGVLSEANYVSINSGATWVTIITIFTTAARLQSKYKNGWTQDQILNEILDSSGPTGLANADFVKSLIDNVNVVIDSKFSTNIWCDAVKVFMDVDGQNNPEYIAAIDNFDSNTLKNLPFLIVQGSVKVKNERKSSCWPLWPFGKEVFDLVPFELTPTYCGIPVPNAESVFTSSKVLGSGLIAPVGFSCDYSKNLKVEYDKDSKNYYVERIKPVNDRLIKMSDVSGISSSAVVQFFYSNPKLSEIAILRDFIDSIVSPKFQFWAPKLINGKYQLHGGEFGFCDGGGFDNTACISLARRKVKNIIVAYSNVADITATKEIVDKEFYDFQALFGAANLNVVDGDYNNIRQIFSNSTWDQVYQKFISLRENNQPQVVLVQDVNILDNPYCGVKSYNANVLFVLNGRIDEFENKPKKYLPCDISDIYTKGIDKDFPYIPVEWLKYTTSLVYALADLSAYSLDNSPDFKKFKEISGL